MVWRMATVDVTVFGAGVFGLSVAYAVAKTGAKVRVIDPNGVGSGSSGGLVGALAPHVPEVWNEKKAFQLESLLMSDAYWAEVADRSGMKTGYMRSGRLQPLADEAAIALARARAQGARDLWQGRAGWTVRPATGSKWEPQSPSGWLVHDSLTARIHPRMATAALGAALKELGVPIVTDGRREGKIVHATGWQGLVALSSAMGKSVGIGVTGQVAGVEPQKRRLPLDPDPDRKGL